MSLDEQGVNELRELLDETYEKLMQFMESHEAEGTGLYQILLHLTPLTYSTKGVR